MIKQDFIKRLVDCLVFSENEFVKVFLGGYDAVRDVIYTDLDSFRDSVINAAFKFPMNVKALEYFIQMVDESVKQRKA